jgi:hypothetical protein
LEHGIPGLGRCCLDLMCCSHSSSFLRGKRWAGEVNNQHLCVHTNSQTGIGNVLQDSCQYGLCVHKTFTLELQETRLYRNYFSRPPPPTKRHTCNNRFPCRYRYIWHPVHTGEGLPAQFGLKREAVCTVVTVVFFLYI